MTALADTSAPGELPREATPPESGPELYDVDRRITLAFGDLARARSRFAVSPSGASITACVSAEAAMNELLELRLSLSAAAAR
jgi:hypothetical protein